MRSILRKRRHPEERSSLSERPNNVQREVARCYRASGVPACAHALVAMPVSPEEEPPRPTAITQPEPPPSGWLPPSGGKQGRTEVRAKSLGAGIRLVPARKRERNEVGRCWI